MRNLRWLIAAAFVAWLILAARREALRRGRRNLALAVPLVGAALLCFVAAIFSVTPLLSNLLLLASLSLIAAAIAIVFWQGFR